MKTSTTIADLDLSSNRAGKIDTNTKEYRASRAIAAQAIRDGKLIPLTAEERRGHTKRPYVKPEVPHYGLRYPKAKNGRGRSMDEYGELTQVQKDKIVEMMIIGCGPALACKDVGVTQDLFTRAYKKDKAFKSNVDQAYQYINDMLDSVMQQTALGENAQFADALAYRRLRLDVESKRENKKTEHRKLKQKDHELEIKGRAYENIGSSSHSKINTHALTDVEEIKRYEYLFNNQTSLTDDEYKEYGILTAKIYTSPAKQLMNGLTEINMIDQVDNDFREEDE